ncbi:MAG: M42 family peptidase [Clostridia bacterium]|nr:M42 family peptidase [Clostridia bacterium]
MVELIKKLVSLDAVSGDEDAVRDFIIGEISPYCKLSVDPLGNIIACKEGKRTPAKKILLDAHMDEVGLIVTSVTDDGFLRFNVLGGINTSALMFRAVRINGKINGVICGKPIHLISGDEEKKLPQADSLYIDIGAASREEAESIVSPGDRAVMISDFTVEGDKIISKALDDRIGCAILIKLLKEYDEYSFTATFTVQEEVGLRGAKVAAYSVNPDAAIIVESTTAADIADVPADKTVCRLGHGAAISFMDRATVYDREYYNAALASGIPAQSKEAVAGGNNAGSVHLSRGGVRTLAISVPCRYIHTNSSVAALGDVDAAFKLCKYMIEYIADDK